MKTKREYIPANIRAGYTAQEAVSRKDCTEKGLHNFCVDVDTFDHGRDVYGNGIARYRVQLVCTDKAGRERYLMTIVESGKRREQVGYGGQNEAALYALDKLGYQVDTSKGGSYDYQGTAVYPLINFPPVESK